MKPLSVLEAQTKGAAGKSLYSILDDFCRNKASGKKMPKKNWPSGNTKITRYPTLSVVLHSTVIVETWPDGKIVLNSGGYRTVTTKARINEFLAVAHTGWKVSQTKGVWHLYHYANGGVDVDALFQDGIAIEPVFADAEAEPHICGYVDDKYYVCDEEATSSVQVYDEYDGTDKTVKVCAYHALHGDHTIHAETDDEVCMYCGATIKYELWGPNGQKEWTYEGMSYCKSAPMDATHNHEGHWHAPVPSFVSPTTKNILPTLKKKAAEGKKLQSEANIKAAEKILNKTLEGFQNAAVHVKGEGIIKMVDPEFEKLLAEEEAIEDHYAYYKDHYTTKSPPSASNVGMTATCKWCHNNIMVKDNGYNAFYFFDQEHSVYCPAAPNDADGCKWHAA